jgi:hypothetical protein
MGGYGSGRLGGWPTVEACDTLVISVDDITRPVRRELRKLGIQSIAEGRVAELPWQRWQWTTQSGDDQPWAAIEYRLELRARGIEQRDDSAAERNPRPAFGARSRSEAQACDGFLRPRVFFGGLLSLPH